MFTGIIEAIGRVQHREPQGSNVVFTIASPISGELKTDQSVAHDGVCLTVTGVTGGSHQVTAVAETLLKTNLGQLQPGSFLNLERAMKLQERLDGHLVQGHVDTTGECLGIENKNGSYECRFRYPSDLEHLLIEKGSICLNGVSLTVYDLNEACFSVSLIPYTYEHTTLQYLKEGGRVNLEFDLMGKYVARHLQLSGFAGILNNKY